MPAPKKTDRPAATEFSIDDFIGEMEKAEDERLNKRLPQERLRNKRALDNAARRAAEAEAHGSPQDAAEDGLVREAEGPLAQEKSKKGKGGKRSAATGMSLKAPKSKANSVDRPTNLPGFEEAPQAGFGHVPSAARSAQSKEPRPITARDISRAAAEDPAVMAQMRGALEGAADTARATGKRAVEARVGTTVGNVGISATVRALELSESQ